VSFQKSALAEIFLVFSKLGCITFGGPLAAVGIIEREVVHRRRWVSASWYAEALGLTNMIPGPTATETAIYVGYSRGGLAGGIVAGLAYIYPSFLIMLVLSALYFRYGMVPAVTGFLYGLNPAAVGVLIWAAARLAQASVHDAMDLALFCAGFCLCYFARLPVFWVILAGGVLGALRRQAAPPALAAVWPYWLLAPVPGAPLPGWPKLGTLLLSTLKAGALLFGGGYVIVPFLAQDFVDNLHWLTQEEFLAAFALGKGTPGPLSIAAVFVGFKAAGAAGALVATLGVFLPGFVILLALAPLFDRLRACPRARGFMEGIRAAAVGAILAAASDLIQSVLGDWPSAALLALSIGASFYMDATVLFAAAGMFGILWTRYGPGAP